MTLIAMPAARRREILRAGAACLIAGASHPAFAAAGLPADRNNSATLLRPGPARVRMVRDEYPATAVCSYNGVEPGPTLRLRQGAPFRATVENGLAESTTVHWHGIRLSNAMDGVPGITQKPIGPGERFDYSFTPPDAGTFWYHPHDHSLEQMGRGLAGALIVEEAEPPQADRELLWTIQDWRLTGDAQIAPGFENPMEMAMDGRVGNTVTINGRVPDSVTVRRTGSFAADQCGDRAHHGATLRGTPAHDRGARRSALRAARAGRWPYPAWPHHAGRRDARYAGRARTVLPRDR